MFLFCYICFLYFLNSIYKWYPTIFCFSILEKYPVFLFLQYFPPQKSATSFPYLQACDWILIANHITEYCCCLLFSSCVWLFCDPMGCSLPNSSVHEISQARILEWVTISLPRVSSLPRDGTHISCIGRQSHHHWATSEAITEARGL